MLTPLELDIMKAVWRHSPITVRDVRVAIRPRRNLAYTTVMTTMNRMFHKGLLARTLRERCHYYESAVEFSEARSAALEGLVASFFDGSTQKLQDFLAGDVAERSEPVSPSHSSALDETLL